MFPREYNEIRPHSSLGQLTPLQLKQTLSTTTPWKPLLRSNWWYEESRQGQTGLGSSGQTSSCKSRRPTSSAATSGHFAGRQWRLALPAPFNALRYFDFRSPNA